MSLNLFINDSELTCPLLEWIFLGYKKLPRLRLGNGLVELVDKLPDSAIVPIH